MALQVSLPTSQHTLFPWAVGDRGQNYPRSGSRSIPHTPLLTSSATVRSVLYNASRILESLFEASGIQSFLLAVDPGDPTDGGFLGGSVVGREFWRGLRGGGEAGAKGFKLHCQKVQPPASGEDSRGQPSVAPQKQSLAKSLKNELYEGVRTALRFGFPVSH